MPRIAETISRRKGGVWVESVEADSLAEACGIEAGDKIWSINGYVLPDSLSFQFNMGADDLLMVIDKADGERWELEIENDPGEPFGVALRDDPIMLCRNKCVFCFVDQNPKGYRESLLIKDEDIRLSFMYGNYSTLSSTDVAEEDRIIRERISPLYVSVHATDPETRIFMLKNRNSGNILQRLKKFADNGIDFHAQVVLCPDLNDGSILDKTLRELAALQPHCLSIAVVPLGITAHRKGLTQLRTVTDEYCDKTIRRVEAWRKRFEKEYGNPLVYLGDEFYIRAQKTIPERNDYRDFPQMENGIGMVRRFLDGFESHRKRIQLTKGLKGTLATGTLFAPVLEDLIGKLNIQFGSELRVVGIKNHSFGASLINVAGLVHGVDIANQLKDRDLGEFVLIPHVMLKDPVEQPVMIDDWYPEHLAQALGVPIVGCGNSVFDLLDVLEDWRQHILANVPTEEIPMPEAKPIEQTLTVAS